MKCNLRNYAEEEITTFPRYRQLLEETFGLLSTLREDRAKDEKQMRIC